MGCLNKIAPDDCKTLLSSDSLSGLMALKRVCMYSYLTVRHGVRTKEAAVLGRATLNIRQMWARGVDFGMMHEAACHNREKNGTTDFRQMSRHVNTMRVTCWLEQLPNKTDLTSWISTVACNHRKILQFF